jgi:hypothetical protein
MHHSPNVTNWRHIILIIIIALFLLLGIIVVTESNYSSSLLIKTSNGIQLHWQLERPSR